MVVDPVVCVDMRGFTARELAGTGVLRAVFGERLRGVDRAGEQLGRAPERPVLAHEGANPRGIRKRSGIGEHQVRTEIEGRRRARERRRVLRARRIRHERRTGDDALVMRADDAVVDALGATEVVRVDDQETGQRSSIAARTCQPHVSSRRLASSAGTCASCSTSRMARWRSFSFVGRRSTIRSSRVRPSFTIDVVESMLRMSFVAVPAFIRLDPAMTSGPTSTTMATSAARAGGESGVQVIAMVAAAWRSLFAPSIASTTYGARPLAEIPTTTSPAGARAARSRRP